MEYNNENENIEMPAKEVPTKKEYSVFSQGLVIEGNVSVQSSLIVNGRINGNVSCEGEVEINNQAVIGGNVEAKSLVLLSGEVEGDVVVSEALIVEENARIHGNIKGEVITINGIVEGNVVSNSEITLSSEARVVGDVSAIYIGIDKGAKILGSINIGEQAVQVEE